MAETELRIFRARFALGALGVVAGLAIGVSVPRAVSAQVADREIHTFLQFDQIELRGVSPSRPIAWDFIGWVGGDFNRVWIRSSGARATRGGGSEAEFEALFGQLVAPFWDVLVGAQLDTRQTATARHARTSAVFALEGLAPYWFELEPSIFVSDRGDVSAELTASYDLFMTQRLIVQPRLDVRAAVQQVSEFGVGSGLNDAAVGFRLRYEISREFAPYVGVRWYRSFSETADLARTAGEASRGPSFVAGLRLWY